MLSILPGIYRSHCICSLYCDGNQILGTVSQLPLAVMIAQDSTWEGWSPL